MAVGERKRFSGLVESLGDSAMETGLGAAAERAWDWHKLIMEAEMAASFEREWTQGRDRLSEQLRALIERGREIRMVDYQRAVEALPQLRSDLDQLFSQGAEAIITPSAPGGAPQGLGSTGDPAFCSLWTLSGMPAISLPLMHDENGMPVGVQLIGRAGCDARLLRTARWLAARLQPHA
jgi:Asp-tRNA(Asn)/Glu-tRNA(Gln) amidotransferase A subunit family amidase